MVDKVINIPLVRAKDVGWSDGIYHIKKTVHGEEKTFSGPDRQLLIEETNAFLLSLMSNYNNRPLKRVSLIGFKKELRL